MSSVFDIKEHVIEASYIREYARATSHSQDEKLWLHVKQYTPKDNPRPEKGDVTIIGGHANAFPKELYEPMWEDLHREAKSRNVRIRSIWIADAVGQGQSGIINKDALGNDPSWLDYARDILQMINHFRPPPPIMAMGHSFGANALTNVALLHPRLLTSLILLDPFISHFATTPETTTRGPVGISMRRREVYPSRAEAAASFSRSASYRAWDPRVLERWIVYGFRNVPGKDEVRLTTTKHQEVFNLLRPSWQAYDPQGQELIHPELVPDLDPSLNPHFPTHPFYCPQGTSTLTRLPNVRPSVFYIFGGKSNISSQELQDEKMALTGSGVDGSGGHTKGRVKKAVGKDNSHLIPMEDPAFCALVAADWIKAEIERWWVDERSYEDWTRRPMEEKTMLSSDWERHIKRVGKYKRGDKIREKI
ncbi:Alpha/beta hydrolase family-domain-containing protein [Dactylonectria macrodidyma]|uniref:Alpha/beta hydrolase family-domain-containing protein n=1 Tax=Dactylonectria macrodidyma TaxID=307937 RepID=A0A9P9DN18_9HYPO|nr:Alpha/beta hydrolase family-domain-containing protein [Dactylonectria macrodidyma]